MKNKVLNIFTLLAMVGMMFTACKKEYPEPPIQDLPVGTVYTIADILEMESGTVFNYDASVYGIVTAETVPRVPPLSFTLMPFLVSVSVTPSVSI